MVYLFRPGDSYGNDGRELGKGDPFSAHLSADVKRTGYGSSFALIQIAAICFFQYVVETIAAENGTIVVMYREAFNNNRICVKQYNSAAKTWSDVGSQSFSANSGIEACPFTAALLFTVFR